MTIQSVITTARSTLLGGTANLNQPSQALVLRFEVDVPNGSAHEDWGGDLVFDRLSLQGFSNWLAHQWRDFQANNQLGHFDHRGLRLVAKWEQKGGKRELFLVLEPAQFAVRPKGVKRGNPSIWPQWALPVVAVQKKVKDLLADPNPQFLADEG